MELISTKNTPRNTETVVDPESYILGAEVETAVSKLRDGKASVIDKINNISERFGYVYMARCC